MPEFRKTSEETSVPPAIGLTIVVRALLPPDVPLWEYQLRLV
jgi:hypothetical protein